jgi:hypothetical protein
MDASEEGAVDRTAQKTRPWELFLVALPFLLSFLIGASYLAETRNNRNTKIYYIAAEEVTWDYGPSGINGVSGKSFTDPSEEHAAVYMVKTDKLLGRKVKKIRFIEYTDESFSTRKDLSPQVTRVGPVPVASWQEFMQGNSLHVFCTVLLLEKKKSP